VISRSVRNRRGFEKTAAHALVGGTAADRRFVAKLAFSRFSVADARWDAIVSKSSSSSASSTYRVRVDDDDAVRTT
jgi:hypothetical protein